MKTPDEWYDEYCGDDTKMSAIGLLATVQRDALEEAAKVCLEYAHALEATGQMMAAISARESGRRVTDLLPNAD